MKAETVQTVSETSMSSGWSLWVIVLTLLITVGCYLLLQATRKTSLHDSDDEEEHSYDGIEELDNPLPMWWLWTFYLTLVFAGVYLYKYPGFGSYEGSLAWTSDKALQEEMAKAEAAQKAVFEPYANMTITALTQEKDVEVLGSKLFKQRCAVCHGANAKGALGYPNLTDHDWLYGNSDDALWISINNGRKALMPAWSHLGKEKVKAMAAYVASLSTEVSFSKTVLNQGASLYKQNCSACHGADGKGNQMLGAPNLSDNIWLYGGSHEQIVETLMKGRQGEMPAQSDKLQPGQIKVLAAYVKSLSGKN